jgi:hypothetical protein
LTFRQSSGILKIVKERELIYMEETVKVELINYFDIWGNPEEGYEVNNLCSEGEFHLPKDFTEEQLLQGLKDHGFLREFVKMEDIDFMDLIGYGVEFFTSDDGCPLGRVEFRYED